MTTPAAIPNRAPSPPRSKGDTGNPWFSPISVLEGIALLGGLVIAMLVVWGQITNFDFVAWDDPTNIAENPFFHPITPAHIAHFWWSSYFELYTPVMYSFWGFLSWISPPHLAPVGDPNNPSVWTFHLASLMLHVVNAFLVYGLLRRILVRFAARRNDMVQSSECRGLTSVAAALGTFLFALHPMQAESVAWITGMNNLLAGFFSLVALHFYLVTRTRGTRLSNRPSLGFTLATIAYVCALLAKPMASATALLAIAFDWGSLAPALDQNVGSAKDRDAGFIRALRVPLGWIALAVIDTLITSASSTLSHKALIPFWGRPFVAGSAIAFYLQKLVVPVGLCTDYPRSPVVVLGSWWAYADTAAVLLAAFLIYRSGSRILQTVALVFFLALLPALGFVPFYLHLLSSVGDRYMYLALIGPSLGIAYFFRFANLLEAKRLRGLFGGSVVLLYLLFLFRLGWLAYDQAATWENTGTLFSHTLTIDPRCARATDTLGDWLARNGDPDAAAELYEKAIRLSPEHGANYYNLGSIMLFRGQPEEAIPLLQKALQLYPESPQALRNLALALEMKGRWSEAVDALNAAIQMRPDYTVARIDLQAAQARMAIKLTPATRNPPDQDPVAASAYAEGMRCMKMGYGGRYEGEGTDTPHPTPGYNDPPCLPLDARYRAVVAFRRAIAARPDYADAFYQLGIVYDRSPGYEKEAIRSYRSALLRRPNFPEAQNALQADINKSQ